MAKSGTHIELSGPFFTKDPKLTFRANIRKAMDLVAAAAEADVQASYPSGGRHRDTIVGRTHSRAGKRWATTAVVSQTYVYPWKNKGSRGYVGRSEAEYRGGKTEARYHMFRRARGNIRRHLKEVESVLVEGLN